MDRPGRELAKEWRKIALQLVDEQGWRYKYSGGHPTLYPADRTQDPIVFAATASDHRAIKNFIAQIRRAGGRV